MRSLSAAKNRRSFLDAIRVCPTPILGLAQTNELINLTGLLAGNYATLLSPVAVVSAVFSRQSIYMVLIGAALTLTFPHIISENLDKRHLAAKILAIIMITGATAGLAII
ncbi:MAG: hypothetical protein ACRDQZ_22985 [Mycobacteriales bacterium]